MNVLICAAFFVAAVGSTRLTGPVCTQDNIGRMYPADSLQFYLLCEWAGRPLTRMPCAAGTIFFEERQICDAPGSGNGGGEGNGEGGNDEDDDSSLETPDGCECITIPTTTPATTTTTTPAIPITTPTTTTPKPNDNECVCETETTPGVSTVETTAGTTPGGGGGETTAATTPATTAGTTPGGGGGETTAATPPGTTAATTPGAGVTEDTDPCVETFLCPSTGTYEMFPNPNDPYYTYIVCPFPNQCAIIRPCAPGTVFDKPNQICNWP